jgi:uncharacterized OB-fold protein
MTETLNEVRHEQYTFSGLGELFSFTVVQEPPEGYEEFAPYVVGLVKLDEGPLILAQLTDIDPGQAINIGDRVEMVTRKLTTEGTRGMIVYGYKFRKVLVS